MASGSFQSARRSHSPHIAQEDLSRPNVSVESPLAAYAETAARETIFFGLEYLLDISV